MADVETCLKQKNKEIEKLREALEVYADRNNWAQVYDIINWGCTSIPDGFKFDYFGDVYPNTYDEEPWIIAQEALKK